VDELVYASCGGLVFPEVPVEVTDACKDALAAATTLAKLLGNPKFNPEECAEYGESDEDIEIPRTSPKNASGGPNEVIYLPHITAKRLVMTLDKFRTHKFTFFLYIIYIVLFKVANQTPQRKEGYSVMQRSSPAS
jgi:hypothetical protein